MDLTVLTSPLLQVGGSILLLAAPVLLTRAFKWLGVQNDATAQEAAQAIVQAAAGQVYHAAVVGNASLADVRFRNRTMNQAMDWACRLAPNAEAVMAKAGWDRSHVEAMLTGEVGKLLAIDPATSATVPDDQFLHAPSSALQPVVASRDPRIIPGASEGAGPLDHPETEALRYAASVKTAGPIPVIPVGDTMKKLALVLTFGLGLIGLTACNANQQALNTGATATSASALTTVATYAAAHSTTARNLIADGQAFCKKADGTITAVATVVSNPIVGILAGTLPYGATAVSVINAASQDVADLCSAANGVPTAPPGMNAQGALTDGGAAASQVSVTIVPKTSVPAATKPIS